MLGLGLGLELGLCLGLELGLKFAKCWIRQVLDSPSVGL